MCCTDIPIHKSVSADALISVLHLHRRLNQNITDVAFDPLKVGKYHQPDLVVANI